MKENLKIKAVLGDDTATMVSELQVLLNEELTRPEDQRDLDYISELTQSIAELSGASLTEEEQEKNISSIMEEVSANMNRSKISVVRRVLSAACSFALIFIAANCISFASFGSDIFHATMNYRNDGYVIDFSNTDPNREGIPTRRPAEPVVTGDPESTAGATEALTWGPTTAAAAANTEAPSTAGATEAPAPAGDDQAPVQQGQQPYTEQMTKGASAGTSSGSQSSDSPIVTGDGAKGTNGSVKTAIGTIIRNKCSAGGFTPVTPPDDFYLNMTLEDSSIVDMEKSKDYYFTFSNDTQQLDIVLEHYASRYEMPELKIPGDTFGFTAEDYPVGQVFFFEDDNVNTALFVNNDTIYTVIVQNIDMDVLHEIIAVFGGRN